MHEHRIDQLKLNLKSSSLQPDNLALVGEVLDFLSFHYDLLARLLTRESSAGHPPVEFENLLESDIDDFYSLDRAHDVEEEVFLRRAMAALQTWITEASRILEAHGRHSEISGGLFDSRHRATRLVENIEIAIDRIHFEARANNELKSIRATRQKAEAAAGLTGNAGLTQHFSKLATGQRRYAETLRWVTVAVIVFVALFAFTYEHPGAGDWVALASRGVLIAGGASLAAYLGRQSGQHRRIAEWATSIEVQLRTLPAFMEGLTGDDKSHVARMMAARALAAPPERSSGTDEMLGNVQTLEAIAQLSRRPSGG